MFIWGDSFWLIVLSTVLAKQKHQQKIWICSNILSLHQNVKLSSNKKFYTDQVQTIRGLFLYVEEVIKSANSFYKQKANKK